MKKITIAKHKIKKFFENIHIIATASNQGLLTKKDFDDTLRRFEKKIKLIERNNFQQMQMYHELDKMLGEHLPIPPLRGYALSPDSCIELYQLLNHYRPKNILEFGSGSPRPSRFRFAI